MAKMDDDTLVKLVRDDLDNSIGAPNSKLAKDRQRALEYYLGDPIGELAPPESEDRSKVVSLDVADTVEWILPSLIRIFTAGDDAVQFEPQGEEDIDAAEQATQWANYVFYRQNNGFILQHNWFKDALMFRLGVVKLWWEDSKDVTTEEYQGLSAAQIAMMMQDESIEIVEQTATLAMENGQLQTPEPMYDVTVKRTKDTSQIKIVNVPPEEFLYSRRATGINNLYAAHHRVLKTISELKAMGYKNLDDLAGDDGKAEFSMERVERVQRNDSFTYSPEAGDQNVDPSMRRVWIVESYLKVDYNGDGIAEWRKVVTCGKRLLDNEEVDDHPFALITPIMMAHEVAGRSIADLTIDIQKIKTALTRQMLDNLYIGNNQTLVIDETKGVNIDDVLDRRVGGVIRTKNLDAVRPLEIPPIMAPALQGMEYIDSVKENRTGVTRYNQGVDANSLNKTASGINAIMNASQQRIELIARIFAETGVKELFLKILKLSAEHQDKSKIIRLNNKFVAIDPRAWKNQFDMTVNVGLGTGNKDQMAQHLMGLMQVQAQALAGQLPIVTPKNVYNAAIKYAQNVGFKDGDQYFTDPNDPNNQQPPKPDPEMMKMQAQLQLEQQKAQVQAQTDQMKVQSQAQADQAKAAADIQLAKEKMMAEIELERQKMLMDFELEKQKLQMDHQLKAAQAQHAAKIAEVKLGTDATP